MQKCELLKQLKGITVRHLENISRFKELNEITLSGQLNDKSWSINQCIEHLSRYADYYLPALEISIGKAKSIDCAVEYKSGWLGNYFAESMLPESPKSKRMSTFKSMNPFDGKIRSNVVEIFELQLKNLLKLLEISAHKSLNSPRIPITISPIIKLKPGDTFRFLINHNERHFLQAFKTLNDIEGK